MRKLFLSLLIIHSLAFASVAQVQIDLPTVVNTDIYTASTRSLSGMPFESSFKKQYGNRQVVYIAADHDKIEEEKNFCANSLSQFAQQNAELLKTDINKFNNAWHKKDAYCYGFFNQIVPYVSIKIRGAQGKKLYIDSVYVRVLAFIQPQGSGAYRQEASYNVLLPMSTTTVAANISSFDFIDNTAVVLKLWSSHYLNSTLGKSMGDALFAIDVIVKYSDSAGIKSQVLSPPFVVRL